MKLYRGFCYDFENNNLLTESELDLDEIAFLDPQTTQDRLLWFTYHRNFAARMSFIRYFLNKAENPESVCLPIMLSIDVDPSTHKLYKFENKNLTKIIQPIEAREVLVQNFLPKDNIKVFIPSDRYLMEYLSSFLFAKDGQEWAKSFNYWKSESILNPTDFDGMENCKFLKIASKLLHPETIANWLYSGTGIAEKPQEYLFRSHYEVLVENLEIKVDLRKLEIFGHIQQIIGRIGCMPDNATPEEYWGWKNAFKQELSQISLADNEISQSSTDCINENLSLK